jgi:hypothetical protein
MRSAPKARECLSKGQSRGVVLITMAADVKKTEFANLGLTGMCLGCVKTRFDERC